MTWFWARWREPESRAAVAAALTAGGAYLAGKIDLHSLGLAVAGAVLAFLFSHPGGAP